MEFGKNGVVVFFEHVSGDIYAPTVLDYVTKPKPGSIYESHVQGIWSYRSINGKAHLCDGLFVQHPIVKVRIT